MNVFPITDTYPTKIRTETSNLIGSYEVSKRMILTKLNWERDS